MVECLGRNLTLLNGGVQFPAFLLIALFATCLILVNWVPLDPGVLHILVTLNFWRSQKSPKSLWFPISNCMQEAEALRGPSGLVPAQDDSLCLKLPELEATRNTLFPLTMGFWMLADVTTDFLCNAAPRATVVCAYLAPVAFLAFVFCIFFGIGSISLIALGIALVCFVFHYFFKLLLAYCLMVVGPERPLIATLAVVCIAGVADIRGAVPLYVAWRILNDCFQLIITQPEEVVVSVLHFLSFFLMQAGCVLAGGLCVMELAFSPWTVVSRLSEPLFVERHNGCSPMGDTSQREEGIGLAEEEGGATHQSNGARSADCGTGTASEVTPFLVVRKSDPVPRLNVVEAGSDVILQWLPDEREKSAAGLRMGSFLHPLTDLATTMAHASNVIDWGLRVFNVIVANHVCNFELAMATYYKLTSGRANDSGFSFNASLSGVLVTAMAPSRQGTVYLLHHFYWIPAFILLSVAVITGANIPLRLCQTMTIIAALVALRFFPGGRFQMMSGLAFLTFRSLSYGAADFAMRYMARYKLRGQLERDTNPSLRDRPGQRFCSCLLSNPSCVVVYFLMYPTFWAVLHPDTQSAEALAEDLEFAKALTFYWIIMGTTLVILFTVSYCALRFLSSSKRTCEEDHCVV